MDEISGSDALTASVDIHATICDVFGVDPGDHRTHGRSLVPLLDGRLSRVRDHLLCGIWGRHVQVISPELLYARAPVGGNAPLSMWSNRWSTMPVSGIRPALRGPRLLPPDGRAWLDRVPGSDVPVIRQPFVAGDLLPFWAYGVEPGDHHLYDLDADPNVIHNMTGATLEHRAVDLLRAALDEVDSPTEQLERLGIA